VGIRRLPTATPNALSQAVSVVSQAVSVETGARAAGDAAETSNRTSADAALQAAINTVSNAVSNEISNRTSADNLISNATSAVSQAVSVEILNRISADNLLSNAVSAVSQAVSVVSQAVSVVSAAVNVVSAQVLSLGPMKAINGAAQLTISVSAGSTISGVSIALVSARNYYFKFLIPYTIDATNGVTIGVVGPAVTNFVARTMIPTTGTANATTYAFGTIPAIGGKVSTISNPLTGGVTLWAQIEGYINPSASGSLKVIIGPTVAVVNLVVQRGAMGQVWRMS